MMNSRPTKRSDAPRGPFKGMRTWLSRILASKSFLLLCSFIVAVLSWGALVASDGTLIRQKVFSGVPVSITGESTLKSRGYIVMDDLSELASGVKLTVEVAQSNYSRVTGTSYNPHFDLSKVTGMGENELKIAFSSQLYGRVVHCEPDTITVNVDRYMTRRVPVVLEFVGETPEGVYLDMYKTEPAMLSVSGPQTLVIKVARAVAQLDLSALTPDRMSDRSALAIHLEDAQGKTMSSDKIEVTNQTVITDAVVVDTELVPAKFVPLATEQLITGKPAEGYEVLSVTPSQQQFMVAARQETLDSIEFLTNEAPIDISGATEDVSGYVRLKRPSGLENALPADVAVTVEIGEKAIERTLRAVDVEIDGLDQSMKAKLSADKLTLQLTGPYGFLKTLVREELRLFVDVGGLAPGEHVLPVQIHLNNAQELEEEISCALSEPEITVTITQK